MEKWEFKYTKEKERNEAKKAILKNASKVQNIAKMLVNEGVPKEFISPILGNIAVETGYTFDPSTKQVGGGPGFGLFQTTVGDTRGDLLFKNLQDMGYDKNSLEGQIKVFAQDFLKTSRENSLVNWGGYNRQDRYLANKSAHPNTLTIDFSRIFERAAENPSGEDLRVWSNQVIAPLVSTIIGYQWRGQPKESYDVMEEIKKRANTDITGKPISSMNPNFYQRGGAIKTVSELYTEKTGKPWSHAKETGLTDGSYSKNLALRDSLMAELKTNEQQKEPNTQAPTDFKEAFKINRDKYGPNAVFRFQGKEYLTNIEGEAVDTKAIEISKSKLGANNYVPNEEVIETPKENLTLPEFDFNYGKMKDPFSELKPNLNIKPEVVPETTETIAPKMPTKNIDVSKIETSGVFDNIIKDLNTLNTLTHDPESVGINQAEHKVQFDEDFKIDTEFIPWRHKKQNMEAFNKLDQYQKVRDFKNSTKEGANYAIVDKKNNTISIYKPGEEHPIFSSKVGIGQEEGDAQTVTVLKGEIKTKKQAATAKADFALGNKNTGAGKFTVSNVHTQGHGGNGLINLMNERQANKFNETGEISEVATSLHTGYHNSGSRGSNGCIRCDKGDLAQIMRHLTQGSEVYVLPEDEGNEFVLENGVLNFKSNNDINYESYTDTYGKTRKGQGINTTERTLNYIPIKIDFDENKFKERWNVGAQKYDLNNKKQLKESVLPFVESLQENKQKVMKAAKINGDIYNEVAKIAFGIFGTETEYGDTHSLLGNVARGVAKKMNEAGSSSPDYKFKAGFKDGQHATNFNSVGLTQVKFMHTPWTSQGALKYDANGNANFESRVYNEDGSPAVDSKNAPVYKIVTKKGEPGKVVVVDDLNESEKTALYEVGITSNMDFMDPKKAALGTAVILGVRYNQELTKEQKKDPLNHLPSKWNVRKNYTSRVLNNSNYLTIKERVSNSNIKDSIEMQKNGGNIKEKEKINKHYWGGSMGEDVVNLNESSSENKKEYYDIAGAMEKNRELFRKNFVGTPLESSTKKPDTSSPSNLRGPESYEKSWKEYLQEHPEHAEFKGILDRLAKKESAFKNVQNYAGAPAYGYFQLWKTNIGNYTPQEFLNNPKVQIKQAIQLLQNNIRTFTDEDWKKGIASGYGRDSMLAGAWLGGVGGVRNFLHRNINANDGKYYANGKGESVGARMMSFRNKMGGSLDKDYFPIKISNKTYYVTTAESAKEKTDGLSGVKDLPKDEGMLFILDDKDKDSEGLIYFTMEDTEVSLDIVFINNNFEVTSVFKGEPFSKKPIYGSGDYVLEVNTDSGISPGDDLEFTVNKTVNNKMMVLDTEGNAQMTLDGGERIFSIKNTKILIKFAKKSTATKKDNDYRALGKRVFKFLEIQDNNEPEFV